MGEWVDSASLHVLHCEAATPLDETSLFTLSMTSSQPWKRRKTDGMAYCLSLMVTVERMLRACPVYCFHQHLKSSPKYKASWDGALILNKEGQFSIPQPCYACFTHTFYQCLMDWTTVTGLPPCQRFLWNILLQFKKAQ